MECEQVQERLSAFVDGELAADEAHVMRDHLAQCPECRVEVDAMRAQNARLRTMFQERRMAARVLAERINQQLPGARIGTLRRLLPLGVSAAAGFLLAVVLFQPWRRGDDSKQLLRAPDPASAQNTRLFVAYARDAVEVCSADSSDWKALRAGESFDAGCKVRTPPDFRCEIRTPDQSEIRLNGDTEVVFKEPRQLELAKGQMMALVAKDPRAFKVSIGQASVTALGTKFDIARKSAETVLSVLEGSTRVEGNGTDEVVASGEVAKIVDGKVASKDSLDPMMLVLTTRWVNEILVLKGRDNPELARRVDDILAQLGQLKGDFMDEKEIRALGDRCIIPLARYLQSPRSQGDGKARSRLAAANILADLAQPWAIPDLIELLNQADPQVRFHAARGLERLAGTNLGCPAGQWRQPPEKTHDVLLAWQKWWRDNQSHFRGAP